jgi:ABC-type sugar transport system ATPase subunit
VLFSVRHLHKSYGGAPALSDVTLDVRGREVHALMGENGAGKSTLIRVLAGVTPADRLEAALDGKPIRLGSPADAAQAGLRFVHQEINIAPTLTVAENIFLAHPTPRRFGVAIDWRRLNDAAAEALSRFGISHISPSIRASRLGIGDRMLMRLASILVGGEARLVVLDEPTAALTHAEAERLFGVIRTLRSGGAAILYVSHRLDEVMALSDRVTVLRDGRNVLSCSREQAARETVVRAMTGRTLADAVPHRTADRLGTGVVCRLMDVWAGPLSGLSLELREGEVLGLAGLENAGQSEVLRLLMGDLRPVRGRAEVLGGPLPGSVREAWQRGLAIVPRERRREALMLSRSIVANTVLPHLGRLSVAGLARPGLEAAAAERVAEALRLRRRAMRQPVRELSGGNQQKVVFGRAALAEPKLLLLDEPTRGVDVGARADIHRAIHALAARGAGVVVASTDLSELLALSHRVLVLRDGQPAAMIEPKGLDTAGLLQLIYGDVRGAV